VVHRTAANVDTSPLGAAMIATVAAGVHGDLASAARHIAAATETFVPDPASRPALDDAYARYRALGERLGLSAVV
jgi:ribulose kinase